KTKRKRPSPEHVQILNMVFERNFFPTTDVRQELARQLGMCPRAVQVWFQNKRQNWRTK
ncbi:homeobox domain-containing protein, partial [Polychytrium aggregatum]|uniref:homeobox domain-containing protein n=1 Tax=Polychytrium aggregatum TaxID=110093 RepID=UPI0022FF3459